MIFGPTGFLVWGYYIGKRTGREIGYLEAEAEAATIMAERLLGEDADGIGVGAYAAQTSTPQPR